VVVQGDLRGRVCPGLVAFVLRRVLVDVVQVVGGGGQEVRGAEELDRSQSFQLGFRSDWRWWDLSHQLESADNVPLRLYKPDHQTGRGNVKTYMRSMVMEPQPIIQDGKSGMVQFQQVL
jgi:hypothetical protein